MSSRQLVRGAMLAAFIAALLHGVLGLTTLPAHAQVSPPPTLPTLSGPWVLIDQSVPTGSAVTVTAAGSTITATFVAPSPCSTGDTRTTVFVGTRSDFQITGEQYWVCSYSNQFNEECGITAPFAATFTATISPDGNAITGEYITEGWDADHQNGHYINCHRDSRADGKWGFSLTRNSCNEKALEDEILRSIEPLQDINDYAGQQLDSGMEPALDLIDPARWITLQSHAARTTVLFGAAKLAIIKAVEKWGPAAAAPPVEVALAAAGTAETANQLINATQSWADGIRQAHATIGGAASLDARISALLDQLESCRKQNSPGALRSMPTGMSPPLALVGDTYASVSTVLQESAVDIPALRAMLAAQAEIVTLAQNPDRGTPLYQQALDELQAAAAAARQAEADLRAQGVDVPQVSAADFIQAALADGDLGVQLTDDDRAAIAQVPEGHLLLQALDHVDAAWQAAQAQVQIEQGILAQLQALAHPVG